MKTIFDRLNDKAYTISMVEYAKQEGTKVFAWGTGMVGTGNGYTCLKEYGVKVDFFCDSNQDIHGKEIIDGIQCVSPEQMKLYDNVVCFVLVGMNKVEEIICLLEQMGINKYVTYDELFTDVRFLPKYFPFMEKPQIAIYTCIVGDYDKLLEPKYISPGCDYYYISDKPCKEDSIYQWLDIKEYLPDEKLDYTRMNRYCKINVHKIFPQYKYSIYVDGNTEIINDVTVCLSKMGRCGIAVRGKDPFNCLYLEAIRMMENGKESAEVITKQIERYYNEGMPRFFGCVMCGVLIREHNSEKCIKLMEDWWNEVKTESKRDQLAFPYVLWKNGYRIEDVGLISDAYMGNDSIYFKHSEKHR